MIIDILFAVFLIIGFISGFRKGIIHSIFAVIALFVGLIAALKFSNIFSLWLNQWLDINSKYVPFLSFILLFCMAILAVKLLSKLVERTLKFMMLGFLNKMAGGILWLVIMTMIFSTLLWFFYQMNFIPPEVQSNSMTFGILIEIAPKFIALLGQAAPFLKDIFDSFKEMFQQATAHKHVVMTQSQRYIYHSLYATA